VNLFSDVSNADINEVFQTIKRHPQFHLERIVSHGQSTPVGEWFDQDTDEWVLLLKGSATLKIEKQSNCIDLVPGDMIEIPARCRHRVEKTAANGPTIWLALHYSPA